MESRIVGVLGGLGPEATVDFLGKLVRATPAASDQDHLHVLVDMNPKVPNRNEAIAGRGPSPGPALAAMAGRLETAGADFLVMVCNAAHAFVADIEAAVAVPLVSIVEETAAELAGRLAPGARVGVLASSGCLEAGLYQSALAARGLEALVPEGEALEAFMALLYRIKGGDTGPAAQEAMRNLALGLIERGADAVVAACTEVPLVLADGDLPRPLVSSTDVLVERTVLYATGELPLPVAPLPLALSRPGS